MQTVEAKLLCYASNSVLVRMCACTGSVFVWANLKDMFIIKVPVSFWRRPAAKVLKEKQKRKVDGKN